jgi:hypothetical protein
MAIQFSCSCGKALQAPEELAGKRARCSGCGQAVAVPGPSKPAAAAPPRRSQRAAAPSRGAASALGVSSGSATATPASLADFFDTELHGGAPPAHAPGTVFCPTCRRPVPQNAVVCINCGYDSRTGRVHPTIVDEPAPAVLEVHRPACSDPFAMEKSAFNSGVIGGIALMAAAVVWFVGGLMVDIIFLYPPVLFAVGLGATVKGLFSPR